MFICLFVSINKTCTCTVGSSEEYSCFIDIAWHLRWSRMGQNVEFWHLFPLYNTIQYVGHPISGATSLISRKLLDIKFSQNMANLYCDLIMKLIYWKKRCHQKRRHFHDVTHCLNGQDFYAPAIKWQGAFSVLGCSIRGKLYICYNIGKILFKEVLTEKI